MRVQLPKYSYAFLEQCLLDKGNIQWKPAKKFLICNFIFWFLSFMCYAFISVVRIHEGIYEVSYMRNVGVVFLIASLMILFIEVLVEHVSRKRCTAINNQLNCSRFKELMILTRYAEQLDGDCLPVNVVPRKDEGIYIINCLEYDEKRVLFLSVDVKYFDMLYNGEFLDFSIIDDEVESYIIPFLQNDECSHL